MTLDVFPKLQGNLRKLLGNTAYWMITYGVLSKKKNDINPQVSSIERGPFSITVVGHGTSLAPPNDWSDARRRAYTWSPRRAGRRGHLPVGCYLAKCYYWSLPTDRPPVACAARMRTSGTVRQTDKHLKLHYSLTAGYDTRSIMD